MKPFRPTLDVVLVALIMVRVQGAVFRASGYLLTAMARGVIATPLIRPSAARKTVRRAVAINEVRP